MIIGAGFDCARLEWQNNLCLSEATGHTPERDMREHFQILRNLGVTHVRDGLPWFHPLEPRLQAALTCRMNVVWDLDHYWRHPDPSEYAKRIVKAVSKVYGDDHIFQVCFNETWLAEKMTPGHGRDAAVSDAKLILYILQQNLPNVRLITAEPAHVPYEIEAHAPFADDAFALGINLYPSSMEWGIADALRAMAARYPGKTLYVTETGLHPGLDRRWQGIDRKSDWLHYVAAEVKSVCDEGVPVERVYLYPIVNTPSWHNPAEYWDHGLIRPDGSVDQDLVGALEDYR